MKKHIELLKKLGACPDAVMWADGYDSPDAAWAACKRGGWMMWLLGRLSGPVGSESRKKLVLCACDCAEAALPYVVAGDNRPRIALETARRYVAGSATLDEVRAAADAACAAASDAAYAASAACDAYAACAAASDAAYAASAACDACDATCDAAYAASAACDEDAHVNAPRTCADIVRKHYPTAPVLEEKE